MSDTPQQFLLLSDLDGTLLGDDAALRRFHDYFQTHCAEDVAVAYASGRFYGSIQRDVGATELPEPKYVIGGVGSDLRTFPEGEPDPEWIQRMSQDWSAERIRELFAGDDSLCLQSEESQSDFKVSYLYPDARQEHLERLRSRLEEAGIRANLIYSSSRDLDFLPAGVDKGTAGSFVAERLGIPPERVMAAGNSGNDMALLEHGFKGIVVANAHRELREVAPKSRAYHSRERHADGVRDGLEHWLQQLRASDE